MGQMFGRPVSSGWKPAPDSNKEAMRPLILIWAEKKMKSPKVLTSDFCPLTSVLGGKANIEHRTSNVQR